MSRGKKRTPLFDPSITPSQHPTLNDIYWLAGFYEGEGCCLFLNNMLTLHLTQNSIEPLDKVKRLFGGKIYSSDKHPTSKMVYAWRTNFERAWGIALTMYPLLSKNKQYQIRLVMVQENAVRQVKEYNQVFLGSKNHYL